MSIGETLERLPVKFTIKRIGLIVAAIVIVSLVGGWAIFGRMALVNKYAQYGLVEVRGQVKHIKLFCGDECKFLVAIKVEEAKRINDGAIVFEVPKAGDTIPIDVEDSRVNLWIQEESAVVTQSGNKTITSYKLEENMTDMTIVYSEVIGSSGLPEFSGTPK